MSRPTRAVILAAGHGSRMLPLTRHIPKPLLPFANEPTLFRTLRILRDWGVTDALINAHHLGAELLSTLVTQPVDGIRLTLSYEPTLLGTGGPLLRNLGFLPLNESFWLFNADVAFDVDPAPLLRHHARKRPLATLWMHPTRGPRTVRTAEDHRITSFRDPEPGSDGTSTFTGLHLISPQLRKLFEADNEEEHFCSIIDLYERYQRRGHRVDGIPVPGAWWADLGRPEQVIAAHHEAAAHAADSFVDATATVHPRAAVNGSVVLPGTRLGPRARVSDALVGPDLRINGPVSRFAVAATDVLTPAESRALTRSGWPLEHAWADLLAPRGSDRSYLRVGEGRRSLLLMRWGSDRPENESFARHTRFLARCGIRVPALLANTEHHRFLFMEDLGDRDLLARVTGATPATRRRAYTACMPLIAAFHAHPLARARRARIPLQPAFSPTLYRWEHDYFLTHFLRPLPGCTPALEQTVRSELATVSCRLFQEPEVLVHRDLQSTNILFAADGPALIDYQGMRAGAAAYDLASFLADPYVDLAVQDQHSLLTAYVTAGGAPEAVDAFLPACVQRLAQALGAYGKLGRTPGTERFAAFVPPALRQLLRATAACGTLPTLTNFLSDLQGDAFTAPDGRVRLP